MSASAVWTSPPIGDATVFCHDYWRVVDRWWTDEPVEREFRDMTVNGRRRVEKREQGGEWEEVAHG